MVLGRRSRSPIGALAAALLLTSALGAPVSGTSDEAAVEVVLLANDGVLPLAPDRTIAVITAQPVTGAGPTLADELAVGDVVDLGPALSAELGTPPPVPAEFLTTPDGHAGLITELFAQPDFTEPLGQERVAGIVRGTDTDLDDAAAVRWTGRLTAPADGRYTLSLAATGHSSLVVDGVEAPTQQSCGVSRLNSTSRPGRRWRSRSSSPTPIRTRRRCSGGRRPASLPPRQ